MTLVIVNKNGLYADKRQIHHTSSAVVTTETCKIVWDKNKFPSYAYGLTGALYGLEENTRLVGILHVVRAFLLWVRDKAGFDGIKNKDRTDFAYIINLHYKLIDLIDKKINSILSKTSFDGGLFISRFGDTVIMKEGLIATIKTGHFDAIGSSGQMAALFDNLGYDVDTIYQKCSEIDHAITREYHHFPREELNYTTAAFSLSLIYNSQKESLTHEESLGIILAEHLMVRMFANTRNSKREPSDRELHTSISKTVKIYRGIKSLSITALQEKINEYYSL